MLHRDGINIRNSECLRDVFLLTLIRHVLAAPLQVRYNMSST